MRSVIDLREFSLDKYPIQRPEWLQEDGHAQLFWASIHKEDCETVAKQAAKPLVVSLNENTGWYELWQLLPVKGDF